MNTIETSVKEALAELTHYPAEVLEEHADWEQDLGIDLAQREEIFTALRSRFSLPPAARLTPAGVVTIGAVAGEIKRLLFDGGGSDASAEVVTSRRNGGASSPPGGVDIQELERRVLRALPGLIRQILAEMSRGSGGPIPAPVGQNGGAPSSGVKSEATAAAPALSREEVAGVVVEVIAELTRYPTDILVPSADLDEELGIDSVKRSEILAALLVRFEAPADAPVDMSTPPRTIGDVVDLAMRFIVQPVPAQNQAQAAPIAARVSDNGHPHASPEYAAPSEALLQAAADRPFVGKVALVTGSGRGLGKVIARELARLGAHVVVNSFYSRGRGEETVEEIKSEGGQATHIWGSVANPQQLTGLFDEIDARFGFLDFYVHNASNGVLATLDKVTPEHWDKALRTNVIAFHQGAMSAARLMRSRGGGRIVTISSPGAQRYIEYFGCLGPAKAALESLSRYLAVELGPHNITVNAVSAGPIYGELMNLYPDGERLIPHWEALATDRKLGSPEDIADAVRYLLSDSAHKINGQVILIDGAATLPL